MTEGSPSRESDDEEEQNVGNYKEKTIPANKEKTSNSFLTYMESIVPAHKNLMTSFATSLMVLGSLALNPLQANAIVSGGRMGGSFGGSTYNSAPSSRLYTSPSSSVYSRGLSRGFSSGYYSSGPRIMANTFISPSPFYSPLLMPRYFGPMGGGVTVVSRGPNILDFVTTAGFVLFSAFIWNSMLNVGPETLARNMKTSSSVLGDGADVLRLSIAIDVPRREDPHSILSVLHRLSRSTKTDSRTGVQNLVSQVAVELLRRKQSIVAASSSYKHFTDPSKAQREFDELSVQERSKFEKETVNKFGGLDYSINNMYESAFFSPSDKEGSQATVAVVTLLLAIDGDCTNVPSVRSAEDVDCALSRVASNVKADNCLRSAEILWTPEDRSETLSQRDILADYPDLRLV